MINRLLARLMVTLHAAYVLFVVFGSGLVLRWPSLLWVHLAAVAWAFATLTFDLGCPLTPWEKNFWRRGGVEPYPEGFLQHHVLRNHFTAERSRLTHIMLGVLAVVLNVAVYAFMVAR